MAVRIFAGVLAYINTVDIKNVIFYWGYNFRMRQFHAVKEYLQLSDSFKEGISFYS
jgi:hypothetical protein